MFIVEVHWIGHYNDDATKYKVMANSYDEAVKKAVDKFFSCYNTKDFRILNISVSCISSDVIEIK